MLRQCCRCKKIWNNGEWIDANAEVLAGADVSHAYCEDCFRREMINLQRRAARRAEPMSDHEPKLI